ncbi:MAG: hypothetical protein HFE25_07720 [Clostridia bacterium]|nr:hypothetical protein [Clostridia bacterium]
MKKIMANYDVGASILSIITESLYDDPLVVFREYVQNSADSIYRLENYNDKCAIRIWRSGNDLFVLDNGKGIKKEQFEAEMTKIGSSSKKKQKNLGYKGIGRLSGVPYCETLIFVNINDYANGCAQTYSINGKLYDALKDSEEDVLLSFKELMAKIGKSETINLKEYEYYNQIKNYENLLKTTNAGFIVILKKIKTVLKNTIEDDDFINRLNWLLPVDFEKDLYCSDKGELFRELTSNTDDNPIRYCRIFYGDRQLFRPIKDKDIRKYLCKNNFNYAVGFHSFNGNKIAIDKDNSFSGIRIYIDNMLLCDENELLQNLDHFGLLEHTSNGQLQSVKGIGAMIYITDKVNIVANARRTFIEVTDTASLDFLRMLAEFVNIIYDTRYALSNYFSAKSKQKADEKKLVDLRQKALDSLRILAKENIELSAEQEDNTLKFESMSVAEQKRAIKKKIELSYESDLKLYLKEISDFDFENAYDNFIRWLQNKIKK